MKSMKAQLESARGQNIDIEDLKAELQKLSPKLYETLALAQAADLEAIFIALNFAETSLTKQADELAKTADGARARLIAELQAKAQEKDAIKKDTLVFLSQIGFDLFPQAETDAILSWINSNQAVMQSIGANAPFDIENGLL